MNYHEYIKVKNAAEFLHENGWLDNEHYENVKSIIMPAWEKAKQEYGNVFVKTGTFSNKFDFQTAIQQDDEEKILYTIVEIFTKDFFVGAMGESEFAFRELIQADDNVPRIYNGMPLRPEFRVFYNFDTHELKYTAEYWEYKTMTDALTGEDLQTYKEAFPSIHKRFLQNKEKIEKACIANFKDINNLIGSWSIDFMLDENDNIWLIDMADARMSAYHDPEKFK